MAGQSHFLICMDLFCTNCQCYRPKKVISGPEFQTEVCGIIVMVKKLIDSIKVTVSNLDF